MGIREDGRMGETIGAVSEEDFGITEGHQLDSQDGLDISLRWSFFLSLSLLCLQTLVNWYLAPHELNRLWPVSFAFIWGIHLL